MSYTEGCTKELIAARIKSAVEQLNRELDIADGLGLKIRTIGHRMTLFTPSNPLGGQQGHDTVTVELWDDEVTQVVKERKDYL